MLPCLRHALLSGLLLASLGGCSKTATPAATVAAAPSANGAITPDLSNDRCKLIPPDQVAEYGAAHDVFKGVKGLEPQFTKGQLFQDQGLIAFQWKNAATQPLNLRVDLLRNCRQSTVSDQSLRETPAGSGVASTALFTSNHGSDYPSGTPALVLPQGGAFDSDALARAEPTVLLAWKATRESSHAARAALPWLRRARRVHLAAEAPGTTGEPGAAALREWLLLHGVSAEVHEHAVAPDRAGERLLSLAAEVSADLLAMGCYGHSRARELLLGGASRSVLREPALPVLMVH